MRLKELLAERGESLYWLAKQTDVRYATIWKISKDKVALLNLDTLNLICEVLGCQPGDLLVRVERRKARKRGKK